MRYGPIGRRRPPRTQLDDCVAESHALDPADRGVGLETEVAPAPRADRGIGHCQGDQVELDLSGRVLGPRERHGEPVRELDARGLERAGDADPEPDQNAALARPVGLEQCDLPELRSSADQHEVSPPLDHGNGSLETRARAARSGSFRKSAT